MDLRGSSLSLKLAGAGLVSLRFPPTLEREYRASVNGRSVERVRLMLVLFAVVFGAFIMCAARIAAHDACPDVRD